MKVWKAEVFYAARWTGDVEAVLAELRAGLKARYGWVRDTDGSERRSFDAEVQGEALVVTMGMYEIGPGYSRGFPIGDETCTIEPGHWVVFDNSDDQGDYLWSMDDAEFHKRFKEIP
jgi:hypothetical protein